jgi:hypothetical protein
MALFYKIRDKNTGLYKNDDHRVKSSNYSTLTDAQKYGFDNKGKLWDSKDTIKAFLTKWSSYPKTVTAARKTKSMKPIPANWEIVLFELVDVDVYQVDEFQKIK